MPLDGTLCGEIDQFWAVNCEKFINLPGPRRPLDWQLITLANRGHSRDSQKTFKLKKAGEDDKGNNALKGVRVGVLTGEGKGPTTSRLRARLGPCVRASAHACTPQNPAQYQASWCLPSPKKEPQNDTFSRLSQVPTHLGLNQLAFWECFCGAQGSYLPKCPDSRCNWSKNEPKWAIFDHFRPF